MLVNLIPFKEIVHQNPRGRKICMINDIISVCRWFLGHDSAALQGGRKRRGNTHVISLKLRRVVYAPGDGQTSPAYSSKPVQYLYISRYVIANKLVLSYLLLRLLLQNNKFEEYNVEYKLNRRNIGYNSCSKSEMANKKFRYLIKEICNRTYIL
jgi:hypothetical protein